MPCALTAWHTVLFGETGCKIYSFVWLHKDKSLQCKILYIKIHTTFYEYEDLYTITKIFKVSGCIALCYLTLISLVFNVYDNCFNSCTVFCNCLVCLFVCWFVMASVSCCNVYCHYTGLFKMIVGVITICHTQHTWDSSICFLFNRTTLQVFVTCLTGALYVHPLWLYKYQPHNRVRSKLSVACQRWWFQWRLRFVEWKRNLVAHGDAREEKWRGKRQMEWLTKQASVWLGTFHPVLLQSFSPDPHSKKASTRLNWHPRRYKWTRPFRWKTESGFCACAITFRLHSTFSPPIHTHPVPWNCSYRLRVELSDGGCFPNLVRNCRWTIVPRQSFRITLYLKQRNGSHRYTDIWSSSTKTSFWMTVPFSGGGGYWKMFSSNPYVNNAELLYNVRWIQTKTQL